MLVLPIVLISANTPESLGGTLKKYCYLEPTTEVQCNCLAFAAGDDWDPGRV